ADAHDREDDRAAYDPDFRANRYWLCRLEMFTAHAVVDWMRGGVNLHVWAEEDVIPNIDPSGIENDAIEIDVDRAADGNVGTIVAKERRLDPAVLAKPSEELAK